MVYGAVVQATNAVGAGWVYLRDSTGDEATESRHLTVKAGQPVTVGRSGACGSVLRQDVDVGFGCDFDTWVEDARIIA